VTGAKVAPTVPDAMAVAAGRTALKAIAADRMKACPWPDCPHGAECVHAKPADSVQEGS